MKRESLFLVSLAVLLSVLSGCSRKGRVIPASRMSEIYAEMFIYDSWLRGRSSERHHADTSLFYEPIFNEYGYSFKDYDRSVNFYLGKPEKFSSILKETEEILREKKAHYEEIRDRIREVESRNAQIFGYSIKDFDLDTIQWQPQYRTEQLDSVLIEYVKQK